MVLEFCPVPLPSLALSSELQAPILSLLHPPPSEISTPRGELLTQEIAAVFDLPSALV